MAANSEPAGPHLALSWTSFRNMDSTVVNLLEYRVGAGLVPALRAAREGDHPACGIAPTVSYFAASIFAITMACEPPFAYTVPCAETLCPASFISRSFCPLAGRLAVSEMGQ